MSVIVYTMRIGQDGLPVRDTELHELYDLDGRMFALSDGREVDVRGPTGAILTPDGLRTLMEAPPCVAFCTVTRKPRPPLITVDDLYEDGRAERRQELRAELMETWLARFAPDA